MKYFNSLTLNGISYSKEELLSLINEKNRNSNIPAWERSIYHFISELLDENDYVLAQSSGTTGKAKQIQLKKNDLAESALRTQNYFGLMPINTALLCLPANYIAGKMMLVRAFVTGFNLFLNKPSSSPFSDFSFDIDFAALTPHQLWNSINELENNAVKKIIVGGAPVSLKLSEKIQSLQTKVYETYGMTETCSHIAVKPLNGEEKSDYFQVLPGFTVNTDERNCLIIHGKNNEVLQTNDIVEIKDTEFKWLGRYDNVINSGGIKIYPEQIEKKLEPFIVQRFLIGSEKNAEMGEQIILILETKEEINYTELKHHMDGILSFYERPKKLYLLSEFIETSNGKINRKETIALIKGKKDML